jgi:hypothetical protein
MSVSLCVVSPSKDKKGKHNDSAKDSDNILKSGL